jgi:hypothetical protein
MARILPAVPRATPGPSLPGPAAGSHDGAGTDDGGADGSEGAGGRDEVLVPGCEEASPLARVALTQAFAGCHGPGGPDQRGLGPVPGPDATDRDGMRVAAAAAGVVHALPTLRAIEERYPVVEWCTAWSRLDGACEPNRRRIRESLEARMEVDLDAAVGPSGLAGGCEPAGRGVSGVECLDDQVFDHDGTRGDH